ncbi:PASTA domain-containing protein, partial [candidate division CSSED10-310 bacterium]
VTLFSKVNFEIPIQLIMKLVRFITIFSFIAFAGLIVGWLAVSFSLSGERITTPDLTGLNLVEALKKTEELELFLRLKEQQFHQKAPIDTIISQKPEAGLTIKKGRNIHVIVSKGPKEVVVPDLANLSYREVESYLAQVGLKLHQDFISRVHSNIFERDKIIAQQPLPGQRYVIGEQVNILVSLGPKSQYYKTPDWIGKNISECRNKATVMNLRLEVTERKIAPEYPTGTILLQFPAPGYQIREGDVIRVIISRKSRLEDEKNLEYFPFVYIAPAGLFPREMKIVLVNLENEEIELFKKEVLPGERVSLLIPQKEGSYLKVYLNNEMVAREEPTIIE